MDESHDQWPEHTKLLLFQYLENFSSFMGIFWSPNPYVVFYFYIHVKETFIRKNNAIKKWCVHFKIFYAPIENLIHYHVLQASEQGEFCTEKSEVCFEELVEWNSLEDPDDFLLFLKTFLGVYWNNWISSAPPHILLNFSRLTLNFHSSMLAKVLNPSYDRIAIRWAFLVCSMIDSLCRSDGLCFVVPRNTVHFFLNIKC